MDVEAGRSREWLVYCDLTKTILTLYLVPLLSPLSSQLQFIWKSGQMRPDADFKVRRGDEKICLWNEFHPLLGELLNLNKIMSNTAGWSSVLHPAPKWLFIICQTSRFFGRSPTYWQTKTIANNWQVSGVGLGVSQAQLCLSVSAGYGNQINVIKYFSSRNAV